MSNPETLSLEWAPIAISFAMLACGLTALVYLKRHGGYELGLTHVAADPRRRRVFLIALSTTLTAFVVQGFAGSVELLVGAGGTYPRILQTVLFGVGSLGIFGLIANAFRRPALSLEEEWTLRENVERVSIAATPALLPPERRDASEPKFPWPMRPGK
jgi:hypothetical protein